MTHQPQKALNLRAGSAIIDITPPVGVALSGYIGRPGASQRVNDRLHARALALETAPDTFLMITFDLLALDRASVADIRQRIQAQTGLAAERILLVTTHTHAGPATVYLRDCGAVQYDYLEWLTNQAVALASQAIANLQPARLGTAQGAVEGVTFNRRRRELAVDTTLSLAALQTPQGEPIATLLNFTCHPVTLGHTNQLISADYPGWLCTELKTRIGGEVLFVNGATGDVNPIHRDTVDDFARTAGPLRDEALRLLQKIRWHEPAPLQIFSEDVVLPLQEPFSVEELQSLIQQEERLNQEMLAAGDLLRMMIHRAMRSWAEETLRGLQAGCLVKSIEAEVQVVCLGDLLLIGVPGEMFNGLGAALKASSSNKIAFLIGYANDDIGYIAPAESYAEGGYEVNEAYKYYGTPAAITPQSVEDLLETTRRLIRRCSDPV